MEKEPLVSVIIPVYNVEKYLQECLISVQNQTYSNFECIIVDDGSPDDCGKIADGFAKDDSRFRVIHQKNGGLSIARNAGYDNSTGEYICFLDSDDYWEKDYLTYFLHIITSTNADIALSLNYFDIRHMEQVEQDELQMVSSEETMKKIFYFMQHEGVWNKMYRRAYLEQYGIRHFPPIKFGEGMTFNMYALRYTQKVAVGLRRVMYYRYNFDSATRRFVWDDRRKSGFLAFDYMEKAIEGSSESVKRAFACHVWWSNFWINLGIVKAGQMKEYRWLYREYRYKIRKNIAAPLKSDDVVKKKLFALFAFVTPYLASKFLVIREQIFIKKYQRKIGIRADEQNKKKINEGIDD